MIQRRHDHLLRHDVILLAELDDLAFGDLFQGKGLPGRDVLDQLDMPETAPAQRAYDLQVGQRDGHHEVAFFLWHGLP